MPSSPTRAPRASRPASSSFDRVSGTAAGPTLPYSPKVVKTRVGSMFRRCSSGVHAADLVQYVLVQGHGRPAQGGPGRRVGGRGERQALGQQGRGVGHHAVHRSPAQVGELGSRTGSRCRGTDGPRAGGRRGPGSSRLSPSPGSARRTPPGANSGPCHAQVRGGANSTSDTEEARAGVTTHSGLGFPLPWTKVRSGQCPSWALISPPGYSVLWTLTYVEPPRIAATTSSN